MINWISQSFLKTMRKYTAGEECGLVVKHLYVDEKPMDNQSKAMALGSYFEFILTGAMPKGGKTPVAVMINGGKDLSMDYKRAHHAADSVKALWKEMGIETVYSGKKLTKGNQQGTIDVRVKFTKDITIGGIDFKVGDEAILDLKYSGLLEDKWSEHGWMWSDIQKKYHGTQAIQYHYLSGLPFFFWVTGSGGTQVDGKFPPTDVKFFHVPVDQHMIDQQLAEGGNLLIRLEKEAKSPLGLVARPSYSRCRSCPIAGDCKVKHTYPDAEVVDLTLGL